MSLHPAATTLVQPGARQPRRRRRWAIGAAAVVLLVGGILAVAVFEVQTLFVDDRVDEAAPVFGSGATLPASPTSVAAQSQPVASAPSATTAPTTAPVVPTPDTASAATTTSAAPVTTAVPATAATAPVVRVEAAGSFISREHDTSGHAAILTDGNQRFLRLTDFSTSNGPDVHVYLTAGVTADGPEGAFDDDFVELGGLKGNIGDQNYEVPASVDDRYRTVVIWCDRFNAVFGAADLA
jgi:hypothetical protein